MKLFFDIKRVSSLLAITILSAAAVSCAESPDKLSGAKGVLRFGEIASDFSTVERTSYAGDGESYRVEVAKSDDPSNPVLVFEDSNNMPSSVEIEVGKYVVTASQGNSDAASWEPYYKGSEAVEVVMGDPATANVLCTLADVKVSVVFDSSITDNFSEYSVDVTNNLDNGSLTFAKDETRSAYFSVSGSLTWVLKLVNTQGQAYTLRKTLTDVKAREHYILKFKVSEEGELIDGGITTDITLDPSTTDIEHEITVTPGRLPMGQFSSTDLNLSGSNQIEFGEEGAAKVNVEAPAGIDLLYITHYDKSLTALGVPEFINLTTASAEEQAAVRASGVSWDGIGTTTGYVDFTSLTSKMKSGEHRIRIMMLDNHSQLVEQDVIFSVRSSSANTELLSAEAFATFVLAEGRWISSMQPEGLTFEYRKESEETWTKVAETEVVIDGQNFSAKIKGLTPETAYKIRSTSADIEGNEMSFRTEAIALIPNLNMDSWSQDGKIWNPWGGDVSQYWDTGNSGVTTVSSSNTIPVDEPEAYKGRGVKMTSVWVDAFVVKTFAAGNLFTGYFSTNISDPKSSVHFGRPFTGRPSGVRFYYKYTSTAINKGDSHIGEKDQMHVYVSLENWDGASERPSSPKVVGYGEFATDVDCTSYTEAGFDITYTMEKDGSGNTIKPTHIVMVATSSKYGADFIGAVGSVLYIDEFEFIYE